MRTARGAFGVRRQSARAVPESRLDRDLAAEIESHLAHHIDDNLRAGMSPDEARRQALLKLGGIAQVQERYRETRGFPTLDRLTTDVRDAARGLLRAPGFAAVAILSLAFGIGANAAIFSAVNGLFFKPLAVDRPDRLVSIARAPGFPTSSYPDFRDLRDRNTVLSGIAALRFSPVNLDAGSTARRTWGIARVGQLLPGARRQPRARPHVRTGGRSRAGQTSSPRAERRLLARHVRRRSHGRRPRRPHQRDVVHRARRDAAILPRHRTPVRARGVDADRDGGARRIGQRLARTAAHAATSS